jgi:hypothetical protein
MPAHAFGLKKNRSGTSLVSKTSDNKHSTPSLGDSEKLSVHDPIGPPVPELFQPPEEGAKIPSSVARQDTGHVFPDNPSRPVTSSDFKKAEHESAPGIIEPLPQSGDAEGLAGSASDHNVNCR